MIETTVIDEWLSDMTNTTIGKITIGRVVDTNDPQQMGRLKVFCPAFGDIDAKKIKNIPWTIAMTPFAGISDNNGVTSYGMWNIPEVGAHVLVTCLNGDDSIRVWLGCIHPQGLTHTMPHGRYLHNNKGVPDGPLSTEETPIQPLYDNLKSAFSKTESTVPGTPRTHNKNLEWRTRGADSQVSGIANVKFNGISKFTDDFGIKYTEENGSIRKFVCNGYDLSQENPTANYGDMTPGGINYSSQLFSWTTPKFHSFSMDDRVRNKRIRIRSAGGHQIIMDDTNERIYISTAEGQTIIELDQKGNIDIFAQRNLSMHAEGDINLVSDQTIRMHGKQGIHCTTEKDIRMHSNNDFDIISGNNVSIAAEGKTSLSVGGELQISVSDVFSLQSDTLNLKASGEMAITASDNLNLKGDDVLVTGSNIHLNGPGAKSASSANPTKAKYAYMVTRVPEHEPWARVFATLDADNDDKPNKFKPEYDYNDPNVNKKSDARGEDYKRGKYWHR